MIIDKSNNLEITTIGGDDDEGIKAGIDKENYGFVFQILSTKFYSNPIGSLIREITSNCFDSHIEAGVDDPVVIGRVYTTEEGYAITFKDVGVGLSPDRIVNVYMNYFSSTKRDNNNQLGGFGLGSKTPLSYADLFYITTIHDGTKYELIYHKGETDPTLESIHGWETIITTRTKWNDDLEMEEEFEIREKYPLGIPTSERNGTVIKVNIERSDLHNFEEELENQLTYFDNVYFNTWSINNDYDIYEGDYFKFRSDIDQNYTEIHLCIEKVRYPIDFNKVNIPLEYQKIPIALKFNIGEIQVTPNREAITYTKGITDIIQDKLRNAIIEIEELFAAQNPEVDNLLEYTKLKNVKPSIVFNKEKNHKLYVWSSSKLTNSYKFKPIAHIAMKKTPRLLFFMWEKIGYINDDNKRTDFDKYNREAIDNDFILKYKYIIVDKDDRYSSYTELYITKELFNCSKIYLIKRRILNYEEIAIELGLKDTKTVGKAKVIKEYLQVTDKLVKDKGTKYSDCRPTDEWIAEYKKSVKESSAAYQRKMNQEVFVRDAALRFRGISMKVHKLDSRTGILVYGFKEDQSTLTTIYNIVINHKASIRKLDKFSRQQKAFMVIQISKAVEKDVVGSEKSIYWSDFLKTKFYRKIETAHAMYDMFTDISFVKLDLRKKLLRGFEQAYLSAKNSIIDYNSSDYKVSHIRIPKELKTYNLFKEKFKDIENLKNNFTGNIPLISCLDSYIDDDSLKEYISYLKYKGIKLKNKWYLKDARQLQYEENLRKIFNTFKNIRYNSYLLTQTLNQIENVNQEGNNRENI